MLSPLAFFMCVCTWHHVLNWHHIQGVFLPHVQCSWERLWIHYDPGQEKQLLKMNEWKNDAHVSAAPTHRGSPVPPFTNSLFSDLEPLKNFPQWNPQSVISWSFFRTNNPYCIYPKNPHWLVMWSIYTLHNYKQYTSGLYWSGTREQVPCTTRFEKQDH